LLRAPQTPVPPVVQEISSEPEQNLAPVQGIRHEVSTRTQFYYLLFFNELLLTQQFHLFRIKIHHYQARW
jgi:hypothetical protein